MRVFIDALGLPIRGGVRSSVLNWLVALGRADSTRQYDVFLSRPEPELDRFGSIQQRVVPIRDRFMLRIWAQLNLPKLVRREKPDLFHAMKNLTIFGIPGKSIITIHDLTHLVLADLFPKIDGLYWRSVQRSMLQQTDRVIAVSQNTKQDLIKFYGLADSKISVIYNGCGEEFTPQKDSLQEQIVKSRYGLTESMILYVGGWAVHKNLPTLIEAFARSASQVKHHLAIVGGKYHTSSFTRYDSLIASLGVADRVHVLGAVPDEDLPHLYRAADFFALPSLNEGFGLVLLEAMACGTPALASRSSSLPEIGGDAVNWVENPKDTVEWSEKIVQLLNDADRREQLRNLGPVRAGRFSWAQTARDTLQLYDQVVGS